MAKTPADTKKDKKTPPAAPDAPAPPAKPTLATSLVWAMAGTLWVLVVAAAVSHDPKDAPNCVDLPPNAHPNNWIGIVGAWISSELILMFGAFGLSIMLLGGSAYLILRACGKKLDHPLVRAGGLLVLAVSVGTALHAAYPSKDLGHPEKPGGMLGFFLSAQLQSQFNLTGTLIVMALTAFVGALLATEEGVFALAGWLKRAAIKAVAAAMPEKKDPAQDGGAGEPQPDGAKAGQEPAPKEPAAQAKQPWLRWPAFMMKDPAPAAPAEPKTPLIPAGILVPPPTPPPAGTQDPEDKTKPKRKKDADPTDASAPPAAPPEPPAKEAARDAAADADEIRRKMEKLKINIAKPAEAKPAAKKPAAAEAQDLSGYRYPPLELLAEAVVENNEGREGELRALATDLQAAMEQYKISGEVVDISSGPVVTLFEVRLAPGTRVSKLEALDSDLARALRVNNIRIVPTIAGKDTVGVEVPNRKRQTVRIRELMEEMSTAKDTMALPMFLGRDATGKPLVEDLAKTPHMLIAGTTGSGKSVCMNSILLSMLFTRKPDELRLILVDPKIVEMAMYKAIPHLLCPVITEMSKAAGILEWACTKMDERFSQFQKAGVRDIKGYNALSQEQLREAFQPATEEEWARVPKKVPYFVIVVDEMADLMIQFPDVEQHIVRIAQKARACGMHLLMATQRPSANVVTGLIKSNMPTRLCMKVNSGLDSRVMLDKSGGEVLLGNGDMLFMFNARPELIRAQGCYIDDAEARETVKFLKDVAQQSFEPSLLQIKGPSSVDDGGGKGGDGGGGDGEEDATANPGGRDPLFEKAVDIVVMQQRGSTTLLQTKMGIGYSRATRLIEQIAEADILGPHKGSQAREVLLTEGQWEQMKKQMREGGAEGAAEGGESTPTA